ncbi:polysaccharide pyruvyl transferase family protein [Saccharopolyspora sp. NPDC000359]|uniref:polysaccharide pyruvyl transferase family protein n=1 Tax=Saccharopolyspora sp. NPDC000359 TaxID=3154251 RepID=UPI00331EB7E1
MRVLITGWASFLHGEATAGDVLSMQHVATALAERGIRNDTAWSPRFAPGALHLADVRPESYTHLAFVCGPAHGWQVRELHGAFPDCRRVALGVSVLDPADPAVTGFHEVVPRDGGTSSSIDLAAPVAAPGGIPVVGVALAPDQPEYGSRRAHDAVHPELLAWLNRLDCARLELNTRLALDDWRCCNTAEQFGSLVDRVDVVVTTRLHGLVFALSRGRPALAVDPVRGGGKVSAQAEAWRWSAVVRAEELDEDPGGVLDRWWAWCRSGAARAAAQERRVTSSPLLRTGIDRLLDTEALERR